jgi:hypothetical protein
MLGIDESDPQAPIVVPRRRRTSAPNLRQSFGPVLPSLSLRRFVARCLSGMVRRYEAHEASYRPSGRTGIIVELHIRWSDVNG